MSPHNTRRGRPPLPSTANALATYLAEHDIARDTAAEALHTSSANISSIVLGKSRPSADLMSRIESWTKGVVTMQSWFAEKTQNAIDESDKDD